jgi:hypothetical protein
MADGYKKPLFTSRALRPGGIGTVQPKKSTSLGSLNIDALKGSTSTNDPSAPLTLGKGVPTAKLAKGGFPKLPKATKIPKMPTIPKLKGY